MALYDAVSGESARIRRDLSFGDHPRQKLDLHAPPAATIPAAGAPLVVFFYGGSWQSGSRGDYGFAAAAFTRLGAVAAVPDYRLWPEVAFPAFLEDAAAAVAEARRAAPALGADPDRVVLAGHSAGAYIAAMLALERHWLAAAGVPEGIVLGFVGLSGPYDFLPFRSRTTRNVFGGVPDPAETQPIAHVDPNDPPALLIHGAADGTVVPANSRSLAQALQAAGVAAELHLLEGKGHAGTLLSFAGAFADGSVSPRVGLFLARVAGPLADV